MISNSDILLRLLVALGIGAVIGLERELRDREAGLRTHVLVSLGAALFTLVSAFGFEEFADTNIDVTRIAAHIVVGIGFLGGGAIVKHGTNVKGLTTAASLWITAAGGLAAGAGFFFGAAVTAVLTVAVLTVLVPVERYLLKTRPKGKTDD